MKKILIVDDEPIMLKLVSRALKGHFELVTASSGEEGARLYDTEKPDMVLSDLKMPVMSGYELQEIIQSKSESKVPFIFMTAEENSESLSPQNGTADYIHKPINAEVLLERIERVFKALEEEEKPVPPPSMPEEMVDEEIEKLPEWILHEPYIDIRAGIKNSGSANNYLMSLGIFLDHIENNIEEIMICHRNCDFETYAVRAHGLKSTSEIIGAMRLSSIAASMERAGKDRNVEFIMSEHEGFISEYKKLGELLQTHMNEQGKRRIAEGELSDAYAAIREYAQAEDYTLLDMVMKSLEKYELNPEDREAFAKMKKKLSLLDYEGILSALDDR